MLPLPRATRSVMEASLKKSRGTRRTFFTKYKQEPAKVVCSITDLHTPSDGLQTDHTNHYSCHPCSIMCGLCHSPFLVNGYRFHARACGEMHAAKKARGGDERSAEFSQRSMAQAVAAQYPLSSKLLDAEEMREGDVAMSTPQLADTAELWRVDAGVYAFART